MRRPQVRDTAVLAVAAGQQRVELAATLRCELAGERQLHMTVGVGARGRDHPRERINGRTQQLTRAQVLGDEDHQRRRSVMFDGALHEPARELLAIAVIDAPPLQVRQDELQVVAARLRARSVRQQLVRGGVDLAGDEPEGIFGDRGDVVGYEAQKPQGAQRHGEPEAVVGPALFEDQDTVAVGESEAGAQILDGDAVWEALKPPALRLVRIPHSGLPSWSVVDLQILDGALTIGSGRQRVAPRRLKLLMAGELGDHHQIVAAPHQPGQTGMAQGMRRQLKTRAGRDEPHVAVRRARKQPPTGAAHEQRPLAVGRDVLALLELFVEDLAHERVERDLTLDLALAPRRRARPCASGS